MNSTTRHFPCQQSPLLTRCCKVAWPAGAGHGSWLDAVGLLGSAAASAVAGDVFGWLGCPAASICGGCTRIIPKCCCKARAPSLCHICNHGVGCHTEACGLLPTASYSVRCDPWVGAPGARHAGAVQPAAALPRQ